MHTVSTIDLGNPKINSASTIKIAFKMSHLSTQYEKKKYIYIYMHIINTYYMNDIKYVA